MDRPGSPPLDLTQALTLVGGDRALLVELANVLLAEELPARLEALQAAIQSGDASQVRIEAHSLKGALTNLAATPSCSLASEIERLGRTGDLKQAPAALTLLQEELRRLVEFLAVPGWSDQL